MEFRPMRDEIKKPGKYAVRASASDPLIAMEVVARDGKLVLEMDTVGMLSVFSRSAEWSGPI